jgi:Leucine-rich repeat (LRR) protein
MNNTLWSVFFSLWILCFQATQLLAETLGVATSQEVAWKAVSFVELEKVGEKESIQLQNSEKYQEKNILYYDGDLFVNDNLDLDQLGNNSWLANKPDDSVAGLWIKGKLEVEGSIINLNRYSGVLLVVEGETKAENIIGGGAEIHLRGGAAVSQIVITPYRTGELNINKYLEAKLIVNDDRHYFPLPKEVKGLIVGFENLSGFEERSFTREDYRDIFLSEYLVLEGDLAYLNGGELLRDIIDKKTVLKESLPITSKRWSSFLSDDEDYEGIFADFEYEDLHRIPKAIVDNRQITSLDLTNNKITEFPSDIFVMQNLKYLDLSGNPLNSLPKDGAGLGLEVLLYYDSSQLTPNEFIRFISTIPNLKVFGYGYKRKRTLEETLSELKDLEGGLKGLLKNKFDELIGRIIPWLEPPENPRSDKIKEMFRYKEEEHPLADFPEELMDLEQLILHDVRFTTINPKQPMPKLKILSLAGSIYKLAEAPSWEGYPGLKEVDLSLNGKWMAGESELKIIDAIQHLPQSLTGLSLDYWRSLEPEIIEKINTIPQKISHLENLEYLYLERSQIDVDLLLEVLPRLKKLKELDLEEVELSYFQKIKLRKALPNDCELFGLDD